METTTFVDVYAGKSIVEIVVDALKGMTTGVTGSVSEAFNALILTEDGKLSALAIWTLSFLGVGFIWKVVPMAIHFFKKNRA